MNFHDEVVEVDDLDLPSPQRNPSEREIEMAGKLVEVARGEVRAARSTRTPTARRCSTVDQAQGQGRGDRRASPRRPSQQDADDLMAALEASL